MEKLIRIVLESLQNGAKIDDCVDELVSFFKKDAKPEQIGGQQMRDIAEIVNGLLGGLGFCLLVFELNKPGTSNYISNADRGDMETALFEAAYRLKNNDDFPTKEESE